MKYYVVSKASQDIEYAGWKQGRNGQNVKEFSIIIKGGANVVDKKTMEASKGNYTEVDKEQLDFLLSNTAFKRHVDRGWMFVEKTRGGAEKLAETELKEADGSVKKDGSAQLTAEDFEKAGQKPPKVGGKE